MTSARFVILTLPFVTNHSASKYHKPFQDEDGFRLHENGRLHIGQFSFGGLFPRTSLKELKKNLVMLTIITATRNTHEHTRFLRSRRQGCYSNCRSRYQDRVPQQTCA